MSVWKASELSVLARIRDGFLLGNAGAQDYWHAEEDVALYHRTFAQRIGWKWDAVLSELALRGWRPGSGRLVDWGCGSGVAVCRVLEQWGVGFESLTLVDRSRVALGFAQARVREQLALSPGGAPALNALGASDGAMENALVLLSHVMSELDDSNLERLLRELVRADALIWVESATHANARRLSVAVRERLLSEGGWRVIAPCTHSGKCPMRLPEHERHWCHHFATPPSAIFQDASWRELSTRLGLDLRSLPYAFLCMERVPVASGDAVLAGGAGEGDPSGEGFSRVIGEPREFKGHLRVLSCDATGLAEKMLQKRDAPGLFKKLRRGETLPVYAWKEDSGRIIGAAGEGDAAD